MIKKTTLICLVGFLGILALCSLLYAEDDIISGSSSDSPPSNGSWDTSGLLNPAEIQPPPFYRVYEATGKEFSLPGNNPYFPNLKITSSEEIHLVVDAIITNCISFHLEPPESSNEHPESTEITISGLNPLWENNPDDVSYWRYQDGYAIEIIKDGEGEHTWIQNLSRHHILVGKELVLQDLVITSSEDWTIQTVDSGGNGSIALDENDRPHISYQGSGGQLKYARWTGISWDIQTVDSGGMYNSIALDGNDYPHISYWGGGDQLKYARWTGANWDISTIGKGWTSSIALDKDGNAHIVYCQSGISLKYWTSSTGVTQELRKGWYTPSIALDSQGRPHISYVGYWPETGAWHFTYTYWTGSSWDEHIIPEEIVDVRYSSIALDENDRPHIAYQYVTVHPVWETRTKYAKLVGSTWDIQTVYSFSGSWHLSDAVSLALDSDGCPHISFYHYVLRYARWDGSTWQVEVVDSAGQNGWHSSLALDSGNRPHINYNGMTNFVLKYATTTPTNQSPECEITSPITGTYLSGGITITFNVIDPDGDVVTVTARIDGQAGITTVDTSITDTGYITFDSSQYPNDGYTVTIECDDGAGGTCKDEVKDITIDNTVPVISLPWTSRITNEDFANITLDLNPCGSDNNPLPAYPWSIQNLTFTNTTPPAGTLNVSVVDNILTISAPPNVNGTGGFDLVLTDAAGLTAIQTVSITINAVNDSPAFTWVLPNGGEILASPPPAPILWQATDVDDDPLVINIYYSISDEAWFNIAAGLPYVSGAPGAFPWDTATVLDDNRYRVILECDDGTVITDTQSANFFTIDNQPLLIDPLVPDPQVINPKFTEGTLLPFELSEPAFDVTVSVLDPALAVITSTNWGWMSAGVHATPWDGRDQFGTLVVPPDYPIQDYTFQITATERDSIGNVLSNPTVPSIVGVECVKIRNKKPVITDLAESINPFSPATGQNTQISFRLFMIETPPVANNLDTTITITNELGENIRVTPPFYNNQIPGNSTTGILYDTPPNPPVWNGTDNAGQTVPVGIYQYTITAERVTGGGGDIKTANPKSGVITVIDASNTDITQIEDITVYAPVGIGITVEKNPVIPSVAAYSLQNLATFGNYPVSPFYNITPDVPVPAIMVFRYDPTLFPNGITLWQFDPIFGFVPVTTAFIDRANNQVIAEVVLTSLFALFTNKDTIDPWIEDLALTHEILNLTLKDDLSGIKINSIKVVLDNNDITDALTITGEDGDLTVTVSGEDVFQPWYDTHTMTIVAQDWAGNEVRKTISFVSGYAQVKLVIKPEALNINPGVLTAYLKFPQPFGIPTTIEATLDGGALERWTVSEQGLPEEGLEGPIIVMKFRRQDIEDALTEKGEVLDTEFLLKGKFDDGTAFFGQLYDLEGQDSITKIITETTPSTGPPEKSKGKK